MAASISAYPLGYALALGPPNPELTAPPPCLFARSF